DHEYRWWWGWLISLGNVLMQVGQRLATGKWLHYQWSKTLTGPRYEWSPKHKCLGGFLRTVFQREGAWRPASKVYERKYGSNHGAQ
ncbi:unnamed protein product, partial [marine sediment metagenome]